MVQSVGLGVQSVAIAISFANAVFLVSLSEPSSVARSHGKGPGEYCKTSLIFSCLV